MPLDLYKLDCPRCGRVEGYAEGQVIDADTAVEAEALIEQQEFATSSGPVAKCRCPQCGTWVDPDRVEPA